MSAPEHYGMSADTISIKPSVVARFLGTLALLLVLASLAGQFSKFVLGHDYLRGLIPLFNVDEEENIPTFFSSLLMLFAAILLMVFTTLHRKQKLPHVSHWAMLSFGFLLMAYDEAFRVHERLILPIRTLLGGSNLGVFYFAWILPGVALTILLGLFFLNFMWHLPAGTRRRFLIAGGLYIAGAIGVEAVGGLYAERMGLNNVTYSMITTLEESLEMAGLIAFIWALLEHCADSYRNVQFRFTA